MCVCIPALSIKSMTNMDNAEQRRKSALEAEASRAV